MTPYASSLRVAMADVLVTGAGGFLGAALVHALARDGAAVTAVVRPRTDVWRLAGALDRVRLERVDLNDVHELSTVLQRSRPHVVIHAAAGNGHPTGREAREAGWLDTVLATASLWECLASAPVERVVHLGSSLECAPGDGPLVEDCPLAPVSLRGVQKAAALLTARQRSVELGIPMVAARVFSVYGPGEQGHRLVPTMLRCLRSGAPFRITTATARRDFVHVDDVVDACLRAADRPAAAGQIVNVGTGVETSTEELAVLAQAVTGRTLVIDDEPFSLRPGDLPHSSADVAKAAEVLGWRSTVDLAEGLARTFARSGTMAVS